MSEQQEMAMRESGLTADELAVMRHTVAAWESYLALPSVDDDDRKVRDAIHTIQDVLGNRVLRRQFPVFWTHR